MPALKTERDYDNYNSYEQPPRMNGEFQRSKQRSSFSKAKASRQYSSGNQMYSSPRFDRYEMASRTLQDRQNEKKAKLVTFYRSGDRSNRCLKVSVNDKMFPKLEGLIGYLNNKMDTVSGVRYIFRKETGKIVQGVSEIEAGDVCIVSSTTKYDRKINYGDPFGPSPSKSVHFSRGQSYNGNHSQTAHHNRNQTQNISSPSVQSKSKPIGVNIVSNSIRSSRKKMMLNPQTTQPFEDMLVDIGMIVRMEQPPATALYSAVSPYTKIDSFSKLFRELETTDTFFVCGGEGVPKELKKEMEHQSREKSREGQRFAPALQTADDDEEEEQEFHSHKMNTPREEDEDDGAPAPNTERISRARAPKVRMETPEY